MAKKAPSNTTQTTKVELPKWVEQGSQENYALAKDIANRPLVQYQGDQVAGLSDMTTDAFGQFYGDLDVGKYYNPEVDAVEQRALDAGNRSLAGGLMQNADKARSAGAFGGSRGAIVDAVSTAENARNMGDMSAQLRKGAFDSAMTNSMADRQFRTTGLLSAGAQEQAQRQSLIDADMRKFYENRDYALEGLNTRLAALGMSPYGKTETTTKTGTSEQSGPDWAGVVGGVAKMLPFFFGSDERIKKNIERVGEDPETGIPIYDYHYKGEPDHWTKIRGPMAQDVEEVFPDSVREFNGVKGILYQDVQ